MEIEILISEGDIVGNINEINSVWKNFCKASQRTPAEQRTGLKDN